MIVTLAVLLVIVVNGAAYVSKTIPCSKALCAKPKGETNAVGDFVKIIINALPEVLAPPGEMNESNVIKNLPKFSKARTADKFRRVRRDESGWKAQDIVDEFNAKYLPQTQSASKYFAQKKNLFDLLVRPS